MHRRATQRVRSPAPEPRLGTCEPNGSFILTERYDPASGLPLWRFWIYADQILRTVIMTDFGAYLSGTAQIRPYTDPDDPEHPEKYLIAYHRNFTQAQIDDLRLDSASWFRECQGDTSVPYNRSNAHISRTYWGPTDRPNRLPAQTSIATQGQEGQGRYGITPAYTLGRQTQMRDQETQQASNTSYTPIQPTSNAAWAPQPSQTTDTIYQFNYTQQQQSLPNATSNQDATTTADTTTAGRLDPNRRVQQAMLGHHRSDSHQQPDGSPQSQRSTHSSRSLNFPVVSLHNQAFSHQTAQGAATANQYQTGTGSTSYSAQVGVSQAAVPDTVEEEEESDSSDVDTEVDPAIEQRRLQTTQWFVANYTRVVAGNGTVYYRDPQRQLWYVNEQGFPMRREDRR